MPKKDDEDYEVVWSGRDSLLGPRSQHPSELWMPEVKRTWQRGRPSRDPETCPSCRTVYYKVTKAREDGTYVAWCGKCDVPLISKEESERAPVQYRGEPNVTVH